MDKRTERSRVAIVTGASRGLGRALARELGDRGWAVVVDARDADALDGAKAGFGPLVTAVPGDVTDREHRSELLRAAIEAGGPNLLVNSASFLGPSPQPPLDRYPLEVLERVFQVNVLAPLALAQLLLPSLRAASGTVVNVTSDAGVEAYPGWGGYGSSKAALDQLTAILAAEEPDIRAYAFDPGDMRTQMHQEAYPGEDISDRPEPETVIPALMALIEDRPPSGRYRAGDLLARLGEAR